MQIAVPAGAGPGTVLEVADPGAVVPEAAVVGISATGTVSQVSGMHALGPQHMPPGFDMLGSTYGVLAKPLAPGESFQSEPGAMTFMSNDVKMSAKFGGFFGTVSTAVSGEALAKVCLLYTSPSPRD